MAEQPRWQSAEDSYSGPALNPSGTDEPVSAVVVGQSSEERGLPPGGVRGFGAGVPEAPAGLDPRPVGWRELVAVLLLVVLADVTIYRGHGYAGAALWFALAPLGLALGAPRPSGRWSTWVIGGMLVVLAGKLAWCGSDSLVAVGLVWLVALAVSLSGRKPYVLDVLVYAIQVPVAGGVGLARYAHATKRWDRGAPRGGWLTVVLPLVAIGVFGTIFVLANPDLMTSLGAKIRQVFDAVWKWVADFGLNWTEVVFWLIVAWAVAGLLRPLVRQSVFAGLGRPSLGMPEQETSAESPLYAALRNTLLAVIVLFAVYLVFEFKTLWFRTFPKGFYYAGYAHEGAAWLTVALALATGVLSLVFRGRVLRDPRLPGLRRLAWIWSGLNLLLALAVYHRLLIYIDFNGMTWMRTVGLIGMTAVVVGFVQVVWKIARQHSFVWLVNRHLWTLAIAIYVLAVLPVDMLVHRYNVRRILAGDLAPSVQIIVHPISAEGVLVLPDLMQSKDPIIREGIRALLAGWAEDMETLERQRVEQGWTSYQGADRVLLRQLRARQSQFQAYRDPEKRGEAIIRFHDYAYQWY